VGGLSCVEDIGRIFTFSLIVKVLPKRFKRKGEIGERRKMTAGGANKRDEKQGKETMVRKE
jgi:hypothetical protein